MKQRFLKIIKLLSIIFLVYGLIITYYSFKSYQLTLSKDKRQYPVGIYENSDSYMQYLFFSENELEQQRNKRFKKIISNYKMIYYKQDKDNLKRKELLNKILLNKKFYLIGVINEMNNMLHNTKRYPTKELAWDFYFLEQSKVLEYLESLQAPVLDNEMLRNNNVKKD